jgi:hypothetical protein
MTSTIIYHTFPKSGAVDGRRNEKNVFLFTMKPTKFVVDSGSCTLLSGPCRDTYRHFFLLMHANSPMVGSLIELIHHALCANTSQNLEVI